MTQHNSCGSFADKKTGNLILCDKQLITVAPVGQPGVILMLIYLSLLDAYSSSQAASSYLYIGRRSRQCSKKTTQKQPENYNRDKTPLTM